MESILVKLIALKQAIKEYHWLAKSYQEHILADKLEEGIDDYADEVAELAIVNQEEPDLAAQNLLGQATQYLQGKKTDELSGIGNIFYELLQDVNEQSEKATIAGIADLFSRISNLALRKLYLINIQLGK